MAIVEEKVKPERDQKDTKTYRARASTGGSFGPRAPELHAAIADLDRVLVDLARRPTHSAFAFLPARIVFSEQLVVFPLDSCAAFCVLQSRPHEVWARFFARR